ncbi:aldo/keto reductase [Candidatus Sumerlaeota bacterium]|nr:aldo/keto reductase [Candidatus Sumerlaeota bacterium]
MNEKKLSRREFIRDGSALTASGIAAGAAIAGTACQTAPKAAGLSAEVSKTLNYNPKMRYRKMGKTGLWVSAVSLGGHWKTREGGRYWAAFENDRVPGDALANREKAIARACELGINYVDITTPAEALVYGQALKNLKLKMYVGYSDHILCMRDKRNRTVEALTREINEGLRRLQVDCIDIFRESADMAGRHTDDEIKNVVEAFHKAHEQGKVRYLGISSHSRPFHERIIQTFPDFSLVIFPFPFGAQLDEANSLFRLAAKRNVGVACIKPFNGGSLFRTENKPAPVQQLGGDDIASLSLRTAVSVEQMSCILPGLTEPSEIENAARCASAPPLNSEERRMRDLLAPTMWASLPSAYAWLRNWAVV